MPLFYFQFIEKDCNKEVTLAFGMEAVLFSHIVLNQL